MPCFLSTDVFKATDNTVLKLLLRCHRTHESQPNPDGFLSCPNVKQALHCNAKKSYLMHMDRVLQVKGTRAGFRSTTATQPSFAGIESFKGVQLSSWEVWWHSLSALQFSSVIHWYVGKPSPMQDIILWMSYNWLNNWKSRCVHFSKQNFYTAWI